MKIMEYIFNDLDKMKIKYEDVFRNHLFYTAIDFYNDIDFVKKLLSYCVDYSYTIYLPKNSITTNEIFVGFGENSTMRIEYASGVNYYLRIVTKVNCGNMSVERLKEVFEGITAYQLSDIVKPIVIKPAETNKEDINGYSYKLRQVKEGILKKYNYIGSSDKYGNRINLLAMKVLINQTEDKKEKLKILRVLTNFSMSDCIANAGMYYVNKWNVIKDPDYINYPDCTSYINIKVLWNKEQDEFDVYNNLGLHQIISWFEFVPKNNPDSFILQNNKQIADYYYNFDDFEKGGCVLISSENSTIILPYNINFPVGLFVATNYRGYKIDMMLPNIFEQEWKCWKKFNLGKVLFNRNTVIGTYNYFSLEL